ITSAPLLVSSAFGTCRCTCIRPIGRCSIVAPCKLLSTAFRSRSHRLLSVSSPRGTFCSWAHCASACFTCLGMRPGTSSSSPTAFAGLPSRTLAGALVGRVLPVIFYAGVVIGSLIVILDLLSRTGGWARTAAGALAALACAVAQLVVGTRIDRLREAIGGPLD